MNNDLKDVINVFYEIKNKIDNILNENNISKDNIVSSERNEFISYFMLFYNYCNEGKKIEEINLQTEEYDEDTYLYLLLNDNKDEIIKNMMSCQYAIINEENELPYLVIDNLEIGDYETIYNLM